MEKKELHACIALILIETNTLCRNENCSLTSTKTYTRIENEHVTIIDSINAFSNAKPKEVEKKNLHECIAQILLLIKTKLQT